MKKVVLDTPDKMEFESPHRAFNEQTALICVGNAVLPTQYSSYIRAFCETMILYGKQTSPGKMQEFDLASFQDYYRVPSLYLNQVRAYLRDMPGILYLFKHYTSEKARINDGLVLTDTTHHHLHTWFLNYNWKASAAVEEARKYVTTDFDSEE